MRFPRSVDAPDPRSLGRHVEKDEAVEHRLFPVILNRPEAVRGMVDEVGCGHLATGEEHRIAREPAAGDERAENQRGYRVQISTTGLSCAGDIFFPLPVACVVVVRKRKTRLAIFSPVSALLADEIALGKRQEHAVDSRIIFGALQEVLLKARGSYVIYDEPTAGQ